MDIGTALTGYGKVRSQGHKYDVGYASVGGNNCRRGGGCCREFWQWFCWISNAIWQWRLVEEWLDRSYGTHLSDFLMLLYEAEYPSPWPERPSVWSAILFQRRLRATLGKRFPGRERFIRQHLGLWAFLQSNKSELQLAVRLMQVHLARKYLKEAEDGNQRVRIAAFLKQNPMPFDLLAKKYLLGMTLDKGREALHYLKVIDVLMREHGYHVSNELECLYRWEAASGAELIDELRAAEV